MANEKAVAEAKSNLPVVHDYGDYAGAGFENQDRSDYSIPFLAVLQGLSPELETLESAKPGFILNKVTQDVVSGKDGIVFVPCYTQHVYVEWVPRDAGGGIVGMHELDSEVVAQARAAARTGKFTMPNGNELIETFYVYGIVVGEDETTSHAVIAFTSTKIKKYKAWMTKARTVQMRLPDGRKINPPLFAHRYRLKTVKEKNAKGEFYNWDVSFDGATAEACRLAPADSVFQEAAQCMELVKSGQAKADLSTEGRDPDEAMAAEAEAETAGAPKGGKAPF
ncbi:hypothetical protein 19_00039 [Pseudomonas phage Epa19]|nr:hypothetical protein 19_00039 [Pseudomonas phage Epa19]